MADIFICAVLGLTAFLSGAGAIWGLFIVSTVEYRSRWTDYSIIGAFTVVFVVCATLVFQMIF